jgi:hypothetical protein
MRRAVPWRRCAIASPRMIDVRIATYWNMLIGRDPLWPSPA